MGVSLGKSPRPDAGVAEYVGGRNVPPMVGSLFSWKSLLTNRRTRDDCNTQQVH